MHKVNPKGIAYENPICVGLPCSLTHNWDHCFQPGRGMEGKGNPPAQMRKPFKKDIAITKTKTLSSSNQSDLDLACTIIKEIPNNSSPSVEDIAHIVCQTMSTILDSGAMSILITNWEYFWTFSTDSHVTVKTVNHCQLPTSSWGDCIANLSIGSKTHRLCLTNCLHALGTMINLLSVGYMVEKGWTVNFLPGPARCQLIFWEKCIGEVPMIDKLVFLNLQFICSTDASPSLPQELTAFVHVPVTWDLWYARIGHPSGDAIKCLPLVAKGVTVTNATPLQHCESCIIAKHPHHSYPSFTEPQAKAMLDLVHSNLFDPFLVITPHSKLHFIVFLNDHTNRLNVQLLAKVDDMQI